MSIELSLPVTPLTRPAAVAGCVRVASLDPADLAGLRARASAVLAAGPEAPAVPDPEDLLARLHDAVPLVDAATRRVVLAVKRAVFAGRPVRPDHLAGLPADLVPGVTAYQEHLDRVRAAADAERAAEAADDDATAAALRALLGRESVRHGIAVTAPEVDQALGGRSADRELGNAASSLSRTATAFVTRAALKPSPASSLATVGPVTPTPGVRADVRIAAAVAYRVLQAAALDELFADLLEVEPAPVSADGLVLLPTRLDIQGYLFRHDEAVRAPEGDPAWDRSRLVGRAAPATHRDAFEGLEDGADPWRTYQRLVRRELLRPVLPWVDHDARHVVLATLCEAAAPRSERWHAVAQMLRSLDADVTVLATGAVHEAGTTLGTVARRLRRTASDLLDAVGADTLGHRVGRAALLHETVRDDGGSRPLPDDAEIDDALGKHLRPHVRLSRAHQALADLVATHHGAGAVVPLTDVLGLVGRGEEADHLLLQWSMLDVQEPDEEAPSDLVVPEGLVAPSLSAHLQPAGDLVVLNAALPGAPAAAVRHDPALGGGRAEVHDWLGALAPHGRWLALATAEEWTDLQGAPALTRQRLRWPADPCTARTAAGLGLDRLRVRHQPQSRTLAIVDTDGDPLAVLPVATISPYMVAGPLRVLLTVIDPWVFRPRVVRPHETRVVDGRPVGHSGLAALGRLVVARETWWVEADSFPRRETGEPGVAHLRRVEGWRQAHGLPDEVFVRGDVGPLELDPHRRKPQWVRWDTPHTLELAARLSRRVDRLVLTAALPDTSTSTRVTETVRLLAWPRTAGDQR